MLRTFLIYLSKAVWARKLVTGWSFAWRAARRFVAGEKLEDALEAVRVLNLKGINATLDHLGEHTNNPEKACLAAQDVIGMLDAIDKAGVRSNVSIKLTQIGLALDPELCSENLKRIVLAAKRHGNFVRIDMEDSQWVDLTLELFQRMVSECHCDNLGVVIQSYLYRSKEDIDRLVKAGSRVRLCKGAYKEPEEIAYPNKKDVDISYDRLAETLIDGANVIGAPILSPDGKIPPIPALATHDELRINLAKQYAQKAGLPLPAIEFQMLYGIRRDLQEQLSRQGYPVRIYVPWGTEWYPYYVRRLAERPANVWFFISNFFRR